MVKAGDVVKVRVVEVDVARKRIGLSMRKDGGGRDGPRPERSGGRRCRRGSRSRGQRDGELRGRAAGGDEAAAVGLSEASAKRS